MKTWSLLVRREFWEFRSLWLGPLAGAGLLCLAIGPQNVRHWLPFAFPLA